MPFEIVRNDIVNMQVDAIVNTANPRPVIGSGTDAGIHAKAGPKLLEARQKIGNIQAGCSAITGGYGLDADYVIHTVGPVWRGGLFGESKKLRSCYDSALKLALEYECQSIAFPLISTGNYGFPKDKALQIAIAAFSEFLLEYEMQIYLVVFNRDAFQLSEKLFHSVTSYVDEHYVERKETEEYGKQFSYTYRSSECRRRDWELEESLSDESSTMEESAPCYTLPMASEPKAAPPSLDEMLANTDAGFTETLLKLIDQTGAMRLQIPGDIHSVFFHSSLLQFRLFPVPLCSPFQINISPYKK